MFKPDKTFKTIYEKYDDSKYKINAADVGDIFDIGGDPACYDPEIYSYQEEEYIDYTYYMDYVIFVDTYISGYFIGENGKNDIDTPFATTNDYVYNLYDISMDYDFDEDEEPTEYLIFFDYLIRHCKNNECTQLQLKIDNDNRYQLFYDYCKKNLGFIQWNNYLIRKIK